MTGPLGPLRIWASPEDRPMLEALEARFAERVSNSAFENTFHGPESTLAGVYTGVADLAWMAREVREPMERMGFEWALLERPFEIEVANGGIGTGRPSAQLAFYVHADCPLSQLSLQQIEQLYCSDDGAGGVRAPRRWGDLRLAGAWADRRIRLLSEPLDSIPMLYVRRYCLKDSRKWNPDIEEIASGHAAIVAAVEADTAVLALAPAGWPSQRAKPVAISAQPGAPSHLAHPGTITSRDYPITRRVSVVMKRGAGPIAANIRSFLEFVLGAEGQAIIAHSRQYLPLQPSDAAAQQARLAG